jgi:hypothetical protein
VPVVSKGDKFVFAQNVRDVVEFLGINEDVGPKLTQAELAARGDMIWQAAVRYVRQMPESALAKELPNRPRSYRVLMHHIFQIPTAFLEARRAGKALVYEQLVAAPPDDMQTSDDIANFGEALRLDFKAWAASEGDAICEGKMQTYYGEQLAHEVLERTVWHSTQHVRQVMSLLEMEGVYPDQPLPDNAFDKLPLPLKVWDE